MDIERLLREMRLEEKVGQMFLLAFAGRQLDEARTLLQEHGVGGCYLGQENAPTPGEAAALSASLQAFARHTRVAIPLLLGVDQEGAWGVMVPGSATGPGNLALGAARSPELTAEMYHTLAAELVAVGYNTLLAPCADVNSNPANPIIGVRSFGEDPQLVATLVAAAIRGAREAGVITTVKHFPGHGDTATDSHRGFSRVDRNRAALEALDLVPFRAGIAAGVDIVMTSHILYPALDLENPATLSAPILQGLLRDALHFDGVILSDSMNMGAIRQHYRPDEAAVLAVLAGVDVIMLAEEHYDHDAATYLEKQLAGIQGVIAAVHQGRIPERRIDEAVRRVLTLKAARGLFDVRDPDPLAVASVGNAEHRAIELRAAVAGSCLIRDNNRLLPLEAGVEVVVVNATPRRSYDILSRTRGIGPNQTTPAFDVFAAYLEAAHPETTIIAHEAIVTSADVPGAVRTAGVVLVVIENYPLPGVDFETQGQYDIIDQLTDAVGDRIAVIALRDPYAVTRLSQVGTVLCTCSSRPCAAQAAVEVVMGRSPATGQLPVSVPGLAR